MPFGLIISLALHSALIFWAVFTMADHTRPTTEDTPMISAEVITPSEFLRLKKGSETSKNLETKAKDESKPDDSKEDTKRPDNAPPPAPATPPPAPEPEPPKPDPGPTPEEKQLLEDKIKAETQAAEAKAKAEADKKAADAKAEADKKLADAAAAEKKKAEEAKKKADEAKKLAELEKKKKADAERRKKLAAAKKKRDEAAKKKLDVKDLAALLDKLPDDGQPKALIDKDPRKKGQQASGSSQTATAIGKEAGTATGNDTVLSAREQDLLKGMIRSQLQPCWRLPGGGGGSETPAVTLRWRLKPDGSLDGTPTVTEAPSGYLGQIASETALRAVKTCQPFRLPPESYDGWKDIIWVFDPTQML